MNHEQVESSLFSVKPAVNTINLDGANESNENFADVEFATEAAVAQTSLEERIQAFREHFAMSLLNMRKFWVVLFVVGLAWVHGSAMAAAEGDWPKGDGDVFPHGCVSFSGGWKADDGTYFVIYQAGCEVVAIGDFVNSADGALRGWTTIIPDDKFHEVDLGGGRMGLRKHTWNSLYYGTAIRTYTQARRAECLETEEVVLEYVSRALMLETTYRRCDFDNGAPSQRSSSQRIFRRVSQTGLDAGQNDEGGIQP